MTNERVRVLHVSQVTICGVRRCILSLLRHADRDRFECEIACPEDRGFLAELDAIGVKAHVVPMERSLSPANLVRSAARIRRLLRGSAYDVVHFHSSIAGAIGRPIARASKVPAIVYTPHCFAFLARDLSGARRRLYTMIERIGARCCNRIIAVSRGEMEEALNLGIAPAERFVVIENGIECEEYTPEDRDAAKRELGLPPDALVVGMTGRIDPQKGIATFLRAAAEVAGQVPGTKFVLIGDDYASPGYARHARELAEELGLGAHVVFTGRRPDAARLAACFDVAVSASLWEGFSISVLEYITSGIPVVATDVSGIREAVEDGANGFIVPTDAVSDVADKVAALLRDPELRRTMGARGSDIARERFTASRMARQTFELYAEILEHHRAKGPARSD